MDITDLLLRRYEPLRAAKATLVPCPKAEGSPVPRRFATDLRAERQRMLCAA